MGPSVYVACQAVAARMLEKRTCRTAQLRPGSRARMRRYYAAVRDGVVDRQTILTWPMGRERNAPRFGTGHPQRGGPTVQTLGAIVRVESFTSCLWTAHRTGCRQKRTRSRARSRWGWDGFARLLRTDERSRLSDPLGSPRCTAAIGGSRETCSAPGVASSPIQETRLAGLNQGQQGFATSSKVLRAGTEHELPCSRPKDNAARLSALE